MAQTTLNSNSTQPLGGPNQGLGTDQGDTWDVAAAKINAMFTDVYTGVPATVGTSTAKFQPAGNISAATVIGPIGSSAATTAQTLATYSLPGGSLDAVGVGIEVTAWGKFGTTGSPGVGLTIGGATGSIGTASHTSLVWALNGMCFKSGTNAQNDFFETLLSGSAAITNVTDTSTDGSAIVISVQSFDANSVQSSTLLFGFTVEYFD